MSTINAAAVLPEVKFRDRSVPRLGLGTWQMDRSGEAREAVAEAIELGYRHIDTAQMYRNEDEVGLAVEASAVPRRDFFLTTKVWWEQLEPKALRDSVHRSLDALRSDYVDLLLIHWPSPEVPLERSLEAMCRLQADGHVRQLGVSNFPIRLMRAAADMAPIATNQIECHVFKRQDRVRAAARELGMAVTAYCPLARGRVAEDDGIREIARRHGRSPQQVALRWLVQQPGVAAIPKASSREHLRANLEVFDFELSARDVEVIEALPEQRLIDPNFAPEWDD